MKRKSIKIVYLLAFIIPILYFVLAYAGLGIYPGGTSTVLIYDMRAQLLALYGYLSNSGPGFDNLIHSMSGGLGGGFFGTFALYISPFDLVYCFVPLKFLPDAIYVMTLLKIGLSGLFFAVFLTKAFSDKRIHPAFVLLFSCCYSLMSYNFMYSMSPMWFDLVMFLPILALMLEKVIDGKLSVPFIALFVFCIICDYYIAYMVAVSLGLYFLFRLAEEEEGIKTAVKRLAMFAGHGLLSAGLASIVIVPVLFDFKRGKLSEVRSTSQVEFIKNGFLEVLSSLKASSYSTLEGNASPNIFCGTIIVVLAVVWFLSGKKSIKARISGVLIAALYFCSFIFGPVDRIWHGFRDPVGFSARYSFTFSFFLICFAVRGYLYLTHKIKENMKSVMSLVGTICIIYTAVELYINGAYIFSRLAVEARFANRNEYNRICDVMTGFINLTDMSDDESYSRLFKNFRYSRFDGALYGYDGLERFSSSYNYNTNEFLSDLGIGSSYHTLGEFGVMPPVAAFLDMGYYLSYFKDCSGFYEPIASDQGIELYRNDIKLPLAMGVDITANGFENLEFGTDPFENVNILYSDISGYDLESCRIFIPQQFDTYTGEANNTHKEYALDSKDYIFTPDRDGVYFFYTDYVVTDDSRYKEAWLNGEFSAIAAYADYYLDDNLLGTFRTDEFTYCNEIGYLRAGESHVLTLESSMAEIGDVRICCYNSELLKDICTDVNAFGYDIRSIGSRGIKLEGESLNGSGILLSLPYEAGYKVLVDGRKTDYIPYRNALMLIPLSEGRHEIEIKYILPGLRIAFVIELLSIISLSFIMIYSKKAKNVVKTAQKP